VRNHIREIELEYQIKMLKYIFAGMIISFMLSQYVILCVIYRNKRIISINEKTSSLIKYNYYNNLAGTITDYYNNRGNKVQFINVRNTLLTIDRVALEYFPTQTPFSIDDFIALVAIESTFNPQAVGLMKERGLFQILKWKDGLKAIGHKNGDAFDIELNTRMAAYLLKHKYSIFKDWKKTIIGYNGHERYWDEFLIAKNRVKFWKEETHKQYAY